MRRFNTTSHRDIYVRPCVDGNSSTGEFFNFSNICEGEGCTRLNGLPGASIAFPVIAFLTGILGQIVALVYLHRGHRRRTQQRTIFYELLATLIWKDLIGKIITIPQPILSYLRGYYVGGEWSCNLHGYSMAYIGLITHLLVAAMAFERYLGITRGYTYSTIVTTFRARMALVLLLVFGLLYCSLPFVGVGQFRVHFPGSWCHINQHICQDHSLEDRIFANLYTAMNLSCLFIIVNFNLVVIGILLKKRSQNWSKDIPHRNYSSGRKSKERELQLAILLVVITLSFLVSWVAHDFLAIFNQVWPGPPFVNPTLDLTAIRLVALNQILEPWSYIICRLIFRSRLWKRCSSFLIGTISTGQIKYETSVILSAFSAKLKPTEKRCSLPTQKELEKYSFEKKGYLDEFRRNYNLMSIKEADISNDAHSPLSVSIDKHLADMTTSQTVTLVRSKSWSYNGENSSLLFEKPFEHQYSSFKTKS